MAKIEHLDPTTIHKPRGWTHVVKATGGSTVYVSGQIGVTPDGTVLAGLEAQAAQAYANLRAALAAAGAAPEHVVKETIFVVDYRPEKAMALRAPRVELWGSRFPASTLVGVQALGRTEYLIEVEAIAVID